MPLQEEPIHSLHVTSPSISSLTDFPIRYAQRLQRAGFTTASEVILINPENLKSQTGLSSEDVQDVYQSLSMICSPKVFTVSQHLLEDDHSFISLGSPGLDRLFGSHPTGIPTGLLTEITGESSSGKTCMSLQLSLNVQLPYMLGGLQGGCIYLCTESAFPSNRLYELATGLSSRLKTTSIDENRTSQAEIQHLIQHLNVSHFMENIHLLRAHDPQTLIHTIHYSLPAFLQQQNRIRVQDTQNSNPIKLIVLDSIAAIFRADLDQARSNENGIWKDTKLRMTERAAEMNQVADGLKFLADRYRLAVVIVNQVSDVMDMTSSYLHAVRPTDAIGLNHAWNTSGIIVPAISTNPAEAGQRLSLESPTPSSSNQSTTTPTTSSSTPTNIDLDGPSAIPLDYHQQAAHFTGQRVTNNRKEAALGLVWANAINIRIMLSRSNVFLDRSSPVHRINDDRQDLQTYASDPVKLSSPRVREAVLVFSPFGKTSTDTTGRGIRYVIHSLGILTVDDYLRLSSC